MPLYVPLNTPARDDLGGEERPENGALEGEGLDGRVDRVAGKFGGADAQEVGLLRGRVARRLDGNDLDVEEERLARERMVEIQHHRGVLHRLDGDGPRLTVLAAGEEARADDIGTLWNALLPHLRLRLRIHRATGPVGRGW